MLTSLFGALGGLFSVVMAAFKWLSFKRTKNIGKMEGELERRREEDKRGRSRRKKEAEVSGLDRSSIVGRLRHPRDNKS